MKESKKKYLETIAGLLPAITVSSVSVNHLDELKAVYTSGGLPAVEEYTIQVQAIYEASKIKERIRVSEKAGDTIS